MITDKPSRIPPACFFQRRFDRAPEFREIQNQTKEMKLNPLKDRTDVIWEIREEQLFLMSRESKNSDSRDT
jgi:hypothetical protein